MSETKSLLLSGGFADPHLRALSSFAKRHGIDVLDLRGAPESVPDVVFDPQSCRLWHDGNLVAPSAAFLRDDVFTKSAADTYAASMSGIVKLLRGFVSVSPQVFTFNHDGFGRSRSVNKGAALAVASKIGFTVPKTRFGNDRDYLEEWLETDGPLVQKPVAGGDLCRPLHLTSVQKARIIPPVIVQERVHGPDIRVFRVGQNFMSFALRSEHLDYRDDKRPTIECVDTDPELQSKLEELNSAIGLTWSASDFKLCPDRGPVYLETNANPMFVGFDKISKGALVALMFDAMGLIGH
jgi:hypothetical protein